MINPNALIILMLTSIIDINDKTPRKLIGISITTQNATEGFKNNASNNITNIPPWIPLYNRVLSRAFKY